MEEYEAVRQLIARKMLDRYGAGSGPDALKNIARNISKGLDLDKIGIWFTLDTTASFPGDSCIPSTVSFRDFCAPKSVSYQR